MKLEYDAMMERNSYTVNTFNFIVFTNNIFIKFCFAR